MSVTNIVLLRDGKKIILGRFPEDQGKPIETIMTFTSVGVSLEPDDKQLFLADVDAAISGGLLLQQCIEKGLISASSVREEVE